MSLDRARVLELLRRVASNEVDPEQAVRQLSLAPFETLDFATVDHHRALRQGYPEVIYGEGKNPEQVVAIAERLMAHAQVALVTRTDVATRQALRERFADAVVNDVARTVRIGTYTPDVKRGTILIITAGTSDLPVAEEAAESAIAMGNSVARLNDVGVAGIHRLLSQGDALTRAGVVIVVAGMDGALPSVVGGLVACPVIAVPTSVGYGASLGGLAALFTMLNSCAAGVTVVNIDNGFGAAAAATRINSRD
ncbi:MAG TPA: nickel pincer cofactor biosynthesis protein LarB [Gemmatimonadaceae bacterium]|nr:nickel pincer cofactor biosynthesis protein LarB [Gemmatimonadaceae bacterium]